MIGRMQFAPNGRSGRSRHCRRAADDALLLVGLGQQQVGIRPALRIAHQAVQLVHGLLRRAAIARHRHPARVHQIQPFSA